MPGDPYPTQDAAATDAITDINPTSISEGREYAGWVYQSSNSTYSYTEPISGSMAGSSPGPRPSDNRAGTAIYHTHGANDPGYDNENLSRSNYPGEPSDINSAETNNVDIYVGTPSGAIKKYDYSINQESELQSSRGVNQRK